MFKENYLVLFLIKYLGKDLIGKIRGSLGGGFPQFGLTFKGLKGFIGNKKS